VRFERESKENGDDPVLLRAMQHILQYLPTNPDAYKKKMSVEEAELANKFPFSQQQPFAFDRFLEIIHYGVLIYGADRLFECDKSEYSDAIKLALKQTLYSTEGASYTKYSSVGPDSGMRIWPMLGLYDQKYVYNWA
jgi:hypothetical protein